MVEALDVSDGGTSIDNRTSGPGSPSRSDCRVVSSLTDDGAVEIRCASYDTGVLGDGNDDAWVRDGEPFGEARIDDSDAWEDVSDTADVFEDDDSL